MIQQPNNAMQPPTHLTEQPKAARIESKADDLETGLLQSIMGK